MVDMMVVWKAGNLAEKMAYKWVAWKVSKTGLMMGFELAALKAKLLEIEKGFGSATRLAESSAKTLVDYLVDGMVVN